MIDAERVRDAMRRVIQAGERSRELLQQIMTFSRSSESESERRPVRLQQLLRDAARLIRSAIPESVELSEEVDPECPAVMADPFPVYARLREFNKARVPGSIPLPDWRDA